MDQTSNPRGLAFAAIASSLAAVGFPAAAHAQQTTTSNLSVSATVTANCQINTSAVSFGSVDTLSGSPVDASGGISVTCTNGTAWSAAAGAGSGSGATVANRRMSLGPNLLNYALYRDAARTNLWGDGTASTAAITGTGTGSTQNVTIYGRIPGGQTSAPAGGYSDLVTITLTY